MTNPYQDQIDQLQKKINENQTLLGDPELGELAHLELTRLEEQKQLLTQAADQMHQAQTPIGPSIKHQNAILEFRQGTGGDEAKIWAEELMRMYTRFTEILGLKVEFIDDQVIKIKGKAQIEGFDEALTAYELLENESGVHRVQRVPVTESQGRVHTSTATVAVLPEIHPQAIEISDDDLIWEFMRSSGAGGQSVNKTSSAVRLTHRPSGIAVTARQERKQTQNRQIALELLRSQLWEIEEEKRLKELGQARSAIGSARRAEKIRTYNFPQNRVTDHRIKESWYNLEGIINGNLEKVISTIISRLSPAE
ncbi:PCRF domain-containing protein [Patescibacteria group bacterium]|nr:PCRF domain-containing protein [Patescibacteria group bacterium]